MELAKVTAKTQEAFKGVAEELGIKDEQDIVKLVKEIRAERGEQIIRSRP